MKIFTEVNPDSITNIYLITDQEQKYGIIIDAGSFAENVYRLVKQTNVEIKKIIVTRNGINQSAGIPLLKRIYDANIYAFCGNIQGFDTIKVMNGSVITEGELKLKVIETPVYSYDSISILAEDALFIGDMFEAGTLSSFDGGIEPTNYEYEIIRKNILSLPDHVLIFPGKGPATTVELERKFNPYFNKQ